MQEEWNSPTTWSTQECSESLSEILKGEKKNTTAEILLHK